jgi:hypothetical protein
MVEVNWHTPMVVITKDNLSMIREKVTECLYGRMGGNMRGTGKTENSMV